jgi:hypothetical protein
MRRSRFVSVRRQWAAAPVVRRSRNARGGETAPVYFDQRASETQTATVVLPDGRRAAVTFDDPAKAAMVADRRQSVE